MHHVVTDARGIPLAATVTAANVNEVTQQLPVVDAVPPVAGLPRHPRRRPESLYGDRAHPSEAKRQGLRRRGIEPFIPEQRAPHGSGLGVLRWFVERTNSWLHEFGRLRRRLDRRTELQDAFPQLACALICLKFLGL
jgi:transposase